jgi:hypothetical protein
LGLQHAIGRATYAFSAEAGAVHQRSRPAGQRGDSGIAHAWAVQRFRVIQSAQQRSDWSFSACSDEREKEEALRLQREEERRREAEAKAKEAEAAEAAEKAAKDKGKPRPKKGAATVEQPAPKQSGGGDVKKKQQQQQASEAKASGEEDKKKGIAEGKPEAGPAELDARNVR